MVMNQQEAIDSVSCTLAGCSFDQIASELERRPLGAILKNPPRQDARTSWAWHNCAATVEVSLSETEQGEEYLRDAVLVRKMFGLLQLADRMEKKFFEIAGEDADPEEWTLVCAGESPVIQCILAPTAPPNLLTIHLCCAVDFEKLEKRS
jgi:hypothetical protein